MLGTALHKAQVLRPEKRRLHLARQVDRTPCHAVDPDRLGGALALSGNAQRELDGSSPALDNRLHQRVRCQGPDEVGFAAGAGRRGEGEDRHRLEEVRLALGVLAQEDVELRSQLELQAGIVAVVAKRERDQPQVGEAFYIATRTGMITYT